MTGQGKQSLEAQGLRSLTLKNLRKKGLFFLSIMINWVRKLLSSAVSAESQSGKENTFQYDHLEGSHRDLHPQSPFKWLL